MPPRFDAAHWRERAREMYALAEKASDDESRRGMLHIAAEYEKLAELAEAAKKETPGR